MLVVTTRLPPATCGVGTNSWHAHRNWPDELAPVTFQVVEGATEARALLGRDDIHDFDSDPRKLGEALNRAGAGDVVLHYAGRAYQRVGCPLWMPGVFTKWKQKFPRGRLLIFFHEIPGGAPMTSKQHWFGRVENHLICRLCRVADVLVTNTDTHRAKLQTLSGRTDIALLPVGSNIETWPAREPRSKSEFVIFGLPYGRLETLRLFDAHISEWHERGILSRLHLIGPSDDKFMPKADALLSALPDPSIVVRHGMLPSIEVAERLSTAAFALTNVTGESWSKSSSFMACAANSCPIVHASGPASSTPLRFAVAGEEVDRLPEREVAGRASAMREWFETHATWEVITERLVALLRVPA